MTNTHLCETTEDGWRPCPADLCEADRLHDAAELAWAAGFLDGEGSIGVNSTQGGRYSYLAIQANQVRREPLDRLARILGGNVTGPYTSAGRPNWKPQYGWRVYGTKAHVALDRILSHLSAPKREQAYEALARLGGE